MGSLSLVHWAIILLVVLLIFGGSRLSGVMGEFAKGIKAFKEGMREDDHTAPSSHIQHDAAQRPVQAPLNTVNNPPNANVDRRVG